MASGADPLKEYRDKRAFERTPEPPAELRQRTGALMFSVQMHAASRLHWDLRLELDGVLKSWAIPKGPSLIPAEKRFAVQTEEHPFDYASFEGAIPKAEYGGGEVIVWDCGRYWCDEFSPGPPPPGEDHAAIVRSELEKGKLSVFFRGSKLKGSWALVRMKPKEGQEEGWLFFKHADGYEAESDAALDDADSVLTGRTVEDIDRQVPGATFSADRLAAYGDPEAYPPKVTPMLATLTDAAFDHHDWVFEPKLDGVRALAFIDTGGVKLVSRRGVDLTNQFPDLAQRLGKQRANGLVLDGEIVAFGPDGRATFHAMQQRLNLADADALRRADITHPIAFYVFDLLHVDGMNTRSLPLHERKRLLRQVLMTDERIKAVSWMAGEGRALFAAVLRTGMEGIVGKHRESRYESGQRSPKWLKAKATTTAEFVVGGYTAGEGSRSTTFGALVLGLPEAGGLRPVGNVGSGFDEATLAVLLEKLQALRQAESPFIAPPEGAASATWVKPEMVVEVKYAEITPTGNLRAPVYLGVRHDVDPSKVKLHEAIAPEGVEQPKSGGIHDALVEATLAQLDGKTADIVLKIGDAELPVTNLNKPLWPASEGLEPFTKRDLLRYLATVSTRMLPHLKDRPLTMIRFPEGIHGEKFFQKHWDQRKPPFVQSIFLRSDSAAKDQEYVLANNLPTLLWLGQLGTLEIHVPAVRCVVGPDGHDLGTEFIGTEGAMLRSLLNYPDYIEFDIDPYVYSGLEAPGDEPELHRAGFEKGKSAAFWLKALLESLGLHAFVKTTGKTGLHVFAPIVRNLDYDAVRSICETLCRSLEAQHPNNLTTEWSVPKRTGKVFLDYNMNARMKTLGCAYSPRALPNQSFSMPLSWDELRTAYPTDYLMREASTILEARNDPWEGILDAKRDLSTLLG